jgi:hypothetical protein
MRKFRRRESRTVRRLAKALAALDDQAALVRPAPQRTLRTQLGAVR